MARHSHDDTWFSSTTPHIALRIARVVELSLACDYYAHPARLLLNESVAIDYKGLQPVPVVHVSRGSPRSSVVMSSLVSV